MAENLSITGKRWRLRPGHELGVALARQLGVPEVVGRVLASRGIGVDDLKTALDFLTPKLSDLPEPAHLLDMDKAVNRLMHAVKNGEQIAIFGDYDVDGSCASALLLRYFRDLGHEALLYIPDRLSEGYGPNPQAMEKLREQGADVAITVDCGSLAYEAMAKAKQVGLDVIITDHHQTKPEKPECVALINPNRVDETSPCPMLSGAGVAFYLVMAFNRALRDDNFFADHSIKEPDLKGLLDLVAVSTICDMVPLTGVNRVLVDRGLKVLSQRKNAGLKALGGVKQLEDMITPFDVGFVIGPRLNAGGRVAACDLGAKILATSSEREALALAERLDLLNDERKRIEQEVLSEALRTAEAQFTPEIGALVVAGKGWHPGVIGIVAARVKEKFHRPTFVIAIGDDGVCKGSGRSIEGVDLGRAVIACADFTQNGGGHAMAAGVTLAHDNLDDFTKALNEHVLQQATKAEGDVFTPALNIDGMLAPGGANHELMGTLNRLQPFGAGNSEPRFVFSNLQISFAKAVGADGSHVKVAFSGPDGRKLDGIAFRAMNSELGPFLTSAKGQPVSVAGYLKRNVWQGSERIQIHVQDAWAGNWQPE